jgi:hypothetical protein
MSVQVIHQPIDDLHRGELLFAGALLIFPRVPGLDAFRNRVAELIQDRFGEADPETAQAVLDPADLDAAIGDLRERIRADGVAREHVLAALANTGVDLDDTYWDRVNLRMLPHGAAHAERGTGWHRDTWGSNIAAQTNWWTPIFPITAGRTIDFAPDLWQKRVANSSADWSPAAARRGTAPLIPEPDQPIGETAGLPVVIDPGDFLCFSAAQLHRSVPNHTGRARFSVEVRTVTGTDLRLGRGARNVDSETPEVHYRWFRHVGTGRQLSATG